MLTLLFVVMMFVIFGNIFVFAIKAAWGIGKMIFMFAVLPILLIGLIVAGIIHLIIPVAIVLGIVFLFKAIATNN